MVNESVGWGDARLYTKAEYAALFQALLQETRLPRLRRRRCVRCHALNDHRGDDPSVAGAAVRQYLAVAVQAREFFAEPMYVVDISRWPQDNLKPSEPATALSLRGCASGGLIHTTPSRCHQRAAPARSARWKPGPTAGCSRQTSSSSGCSRSPLRSDSTPGLRTTRAGIAGSALLFVSGIGLLLAAVFPLREDAAGITYDPAGHIVAGLAFFVTSAVGLIVLSRPLARDPRWRSLALYTRMAGAVSVAGFVVMGVLVMPDDAPLHDWAGLAQRLLILVALFPCRIVLSLRLLQVESGERT